MGNYRLVVPEHITKTKKHYLYCHFVIDSPTPFYVGIGTNNKLKSFSRSKSSSGRNKYWKEKSRSKYIIIICCESDNYEYIKELEREFITLYGFENLTNLTFGGEGCNGYKHTKDHIQKLKYNYRNGDSILKSRIISTEERLNKSLQYSGKGNPNYGKSGIKTKRSKEVLKYSLEGELIHTYGSLRNASITEKVSHTSIRKAILNNTKCNNFKWKYNGCTEESSINRV